MRAIASMWVLGVAILAVLWGCAPQGVQPSGEDVRSQIAEAYGIQSFGLIQKLQYTYNRKNGESLERRFWIWEPATDQVTFQEGYRPEVTYRRGELTATASADLKQIDQWFLHDNYWLLFPFRAAWDHQAEVADMGACRTPLDKESARCVNVVYPSAVPGRVIGDAFKLYLGADYRIMEWIYTPQGPGDTAYTTRWGMHRWVGPVLLALERSGADPEARIWFSGVGIQLTNDTWIWAD